MFPNFVPEGIGLPGLIALIAVTHVFVAHFAVGAGMYLVTTERWARRLNRPGLLAHTERHTRFFVLLTLVFGALSGVGIWFVIGLAAPDTTFLLIRTFVWAWAAEWCFFAIELSAALAYYKTWHRLSPRDHMAIGWLYAIASIVTLCIINGILSFMLTPGDWVETRNFWDGLFNPTYLSSTVMRLGICVLIAGAFALVTGNSRRHEIDPEDRRLLLARAGRWLVGGLVLAVPMFLLLKSQFTPEISDLLQRSLRGARGSVPLLGTLWRIGGVALGVVGLAGLFLALRRPSRVPRIVPVAVVLLAFVGFGCGEYAREVLRKPFGVRNVIYVNGIAVEDVARFREEGFLQHTKEAEVLSSGDPMRIGEAMYRTQCSTCHTLDGYRGLRDRLSGWHENQVGVLVSSLARQQPGGPAVWQAMPPLVGNEDEIAALRAWLNTLTLPN